MRGRLNLASLTEKHFSEFLVAAFLAALGLLDMAPVMFIFLLLYYFTDASGCGFNLSVKISEYL
jgi:hypothetical protein